MIGKLSDNHSTCQGIIQKSNSLAATWKVNTSTLQSRFKIKWKLHYGSEISDMLIKVLQNQQHSTVRCTEATVTRSALLCLFRLQLNFSRLLQKVQCLRRLVAGFSTWLLGFDPETVSRAFFVHKLEMIVFFYHLFLSHFQYYFANLHLFISFT
jgi:hypothetical protein